MTQVTFATATGMKSLEDVVPLEDYPGFSVHPDGFIMRMPTTYERNGKKVNRAARVLVPFTRGNGQLYVNIVDKEGKRKARLIAELVCLAFNIKKTAENQRIKFLNGDKADCRPENLAWQTSTKRYTVTKRLEWLENESKSIRAMLDSHDAWGEDMQTLRAVSKELPLVAEQQFEHHKLLLELQEQVRDLQALLVDQAQERLDEENTSEDKPKAKAATYPEGKFWWPFEEQGTPENEFWPVDADAVDVEGTIYYKYAGEVFSANRQGIPVLKGGGSPMFLLANPAYQALQEARAQHKKEEAAKLKAETKG